MNQSEKPVLYHAAPAVCAQKVRIVLAEKSIDYDGRLLDFARNEQLAPDYLRLNPNGVVPTLVHDGEVITESTVISEYLDEAFDGPDLRPADALGRAHLHLWSRREDGIHDIVNTLTTVAVFRPALLAAGAQARAARLAGLPDPARRAKLVELLDRGTGSPIVSMALGKLGRHLRDMEAALRNGAWLLGDAFSLADAGLISFFARLESLCLTSLWAGQQANVTRWFAACKARSSFDTAITAFIPADEKSHYMTMGQTIAAELLQVHIAAEV